jgi:hypothetical protein
VLGLPVFPRGLDKAIVAIMSTNDLIEGEAFLDEEENDESFDEETGEVRQAHGTGSGPYGDSSEEDDDEEDDEEAARAVCGPIAPMSFRWGFPVLTMCDPRSAKVSSSTRMKKSKNGRKGVERERSAGGKSGSARMKHSTRKICI